MQRKVISVFILLAMLFQIVIPVVPVYAAPSIFAGGDGSEGNPYQISTADQLQAFAQSVPIEGSNYYQKYIVLTNDINLDDSNDEYMSEGSNWLVYIGNEENQFSGHFNGMGHTISNMRIYSSTNNTGLFGYVYYDGVIENLMLQSPSVTVTGAVYHAGTIAGTNDGLIQNCKVVGTDPIQMTDNGAFNAGGIVGSVEENGVVRNCVSDIPVLGGWSAGGIAGINTGTVLNCLALNDVDRYDSESEHVNFGAIVGYNHSEVANCIFADNASTGFDPLEAVGGAEEGSSSSDNYYINPSDSENAVNIDGNPYYQYESFFQDSDIWNTAEGPWDFDDIWTTDGDSAPIYLLPQAAPEAEGSTWQDFAATELDGTGTEEDPYLIGTPEELAFLAKQVNSGASYANEFFSITADIDLSNHEWIPIGGWNAALNEATENQFAGILDGGGHTISGMQIGEEASSNNTLQYVGLFGYTGGESRIFDVSIAESSIYSAFAENDASTDGSYIGILVGHSQGTVESCEVAGIIECGSSDDTWLDVGGLVGLGNGSLITGSSADVDVLTGYIENDLFAGGLIGKLQAGAVGNSWSTGDVEIGGINSGWSWGMAGGLVGYSSASVYNCYSTGDVTGADGIIVGGFVGRMESGEIDNCYSRGNVIGNDDAAVGGFVGYPYEGYIQNCYATGDTTGGNASDVGGFNGDYDDASIWDSYFNEDATQMVNGFPVTPATSTEASGMTEADMKSDDFKDTLNENASTIEIFEESPEMEFSAWVREDGTNDGYPCFSSESADTPFNPLSNAEAGNYQIEFVQSTETGDEYTINGDDIAITEDVTTVEDFLEGVSFTPEDTEYKLFRSENVNELTGMNVNEIYSNFSNSENNITGTDTLGETTYLIAFNAAHDRFASYVITAEPQSYVMDNGKLRFGDGVVPSINTKGGLQQPFYYNTQWYKLTYSTLPLDYAVALGGINNGGWNNNGTKSINTDLTDLTVDYASLNNGAGTISAVGQLTVDGKLIEVTNRYELGSEASFVKIITTVKNLTASTIDNVRYWTGTVDDWVGTTDSPTKYKGNLIDGAFVQNTADDQQAKVLKIYSGDHNVLFFSTHPTTEMMITNRSLDTLTSSDPRTNPRTGSMDQAYGMYVNLGNLTAGASSSFTWYYAAGSVADIGNIIEDVGGDSEPIASTIIFADGAEVSRVMGSGTYTNAVSGDGDGAITYTSGTPATATVNATTGQVTLVAPGTTVITATKAATATHAAVINTYTLTVTAAPPSGGDRGDTTPPPTNQAPVVVIVNGKVENAGTETKTTEEGKSVITVEVNNKVIESKIEEAIKNNPAGTNNLIQVPVADTKSDVVKVGLSGDIIKQLEANTFDLSIKRDNIEYLIPAEELTISNVAKDLGVPESSLKDIKIEIKITKLDASVTAKYNEVAKANGAELVFPPVAFEIVAKTTKADGTKTGVEISKFSNYVERIMEILAGVDPSKITTGIVFNPDGTYSHVPTEVFQKDGKWYAKLNSLTNSNYSVVWNPVIVKSVEKHWSKDAVNDMASRLVVFDPENFDPNQAITRADFAEYIVRALGLYRVGSTHENNFSDIKASGDRTLAILIANEYGIITGYPDGTFRPDAKITREEAMAMYQRAMKITKLVGTDLNRYQTYTDYKQVGNWATDFVKDVLSAHVFNGTTSTTISPKANLTYAEAAQAIKNLLVESKLINK